MELVARRDDSDLRLGFQPPKFADRRQCAETRAENCDFVHCALLVERSYPADWSARIGVSVLLKLRAPAESSNRPCRMASTSPSTRGTQSS